MNCGQEQNSGWRDNKWLFFALFLVVIMIFSRSDGSPWWLILDLWWIIPGVTGRHQHGSSCASGDQGKRKRTPDDEKPKREPLYIYDEDGTALEVIDEKPKR